VARIVIVEDDALVAKYLKYVLDQEGRYDVVVTESGDDVLAFARDPITAAIVVDVSLRNTQLQGRYVDGLELSRSIKADPAGARVPIVIATAHTMAGDRERFLRESSANAFIRKPITDSREVLSLIADLVRGGNER
jgi:two-component system, cell cycle response regulator DivK